LIFRHEFIIKVYYIIKFINEETPFNTKNILLTILSWNFNILNKNIFNIILKNLKRINWRTFINQKKYFKLFFLYFYNLLTNLL
jgi:hypothetical protein